MDVMAKAEVCATHPDDDTGIECTEIWLTRQENRGAGMFDKGSSRSGVEAVTLENALCGVQTQRPEVTVCPGSCAVGLMDVMAKAEVCATHPDDDTGIECTEIWLTRQENRGAGSSDRELVSQSGLGQTWKQSSFDNLLLATGDPASAMLEQSTASVDEGSSTDESETSEEEEDLNEDEDEDEESSGEDEGDEDEEEEGEGEEEEESEEDEEEEEEDEDEEEEEEEVEGEDDEVVDLQDAVGHKPNVDSRETFCVPPKLVPAGNRVRSGPTLNRRPWYSEQHLWLNPCANPFCTEDC